MSYIVNHPYDNSELTTPFMGWNRLEGRPRSRQFDHALQARIHDPLWMLGRQWQMGEYTGNDTGTGIAARAELSYRSIAGIAAVDQEPAPYDQSLPLEPLVEAIPYAWSIKEQLIIGKKWATLLVKNSLWIPFGSLFKDAENGFMIDDLEPDSTDSDTAIINKALLFSDKNLKPLLAAAGRTGKNINGAKVYTTLKDPNWLENLATTFSLDVSDIAPLDIIRDTFLTWLDTLFIRPENIAANPGFANNWNKRQLEYQFDTYWPAEDNTQYRLSAQTYHQGHFDWYAFDMASEQQDNGLDNDEPSTKVLQLLMSQSRFAGMPSTRWFELEHGGVNFCRLDGNTTDIAKIITTQFALVYQDDWFRIPYALPVGSYAEMKGIVVTDVFGVKTFVANYNINDYTDQGFIEENEHWKNWHWMDTSVKDNVVNGAAPAQKFLLPPVTDVLMESDPLESVLFIRDESANMVWGIEKTLRNVMGKGADGYNRAASFLSYLKMIKPAPEESAAPVVTGAELEYQLSVNTPPENWIPFIPVHMSGSNRSVQLQRATIPRLLPPYSDSLIRPRSELLSDGIATSQPFYIFEEEVPRAGCIVNTTYQRVRWYNGKICIWVGRQKQTGRGEGSSGLTFDKVTDKS